MQPGHTVATIDAAQLRASLLRAQADTASAMSQVASATASVTQAKSQLKLTELEFNRADKLIRNQHISQAKFDAALSRRDIGIATLGTNQTSDVTSRTSACGAN